MILTHVFVRCVGWAWRLLTPRQWGRLAHVALGGVAYSCALAGAWFLPRLLAGCCAAPAGHPVDVPEPASTLMVLSAGIAMLALARRARKK